MTPVTHVDFKAYPLNHSQREGNDTEPGRPRKTSANAPRLVLDYGFVLRRLVCPRRLSCAATTILVWTRQKSAFGAMRPSLSAPTSVTLFKQKQVLSLGHAERVFAYSRLSPVR
jgi:hypothetical protein